MGFNLDNYEQVKDRITRFYKDHPDGRILTELVNDPGTLQTFAAFQAMVYLGETLKATGYAYEAQGQGVNRDAWVENAETSAIGRALANMDYCGTMRPSREEMSKVGNGESIPEAVVDLRDILWDYIKSGKLTEVAVDTVKHALEAGESDVAKLKAYVARCKSIVEGK